MSENLRITSRDNSKIKLARRVRDGRESGLIFIEGIRLVEEAIRSEIELVDAFVSDAISDAHRATPIFAALKAQGTAVYNVPKTIADSISDTESGQGIVAIATRPDEGTSDLLSVKAGGIPIILFLDQINNPANLGAVIRTAEAAGVIKIIISSGSADPFSPKALRAAMGSTFRVPIRTGANLDTILALARSSGYTSTAADITAAAAHTSLNWKKPRLLIFGSEAHGLKPEILGRIDELTIIKMETAVESLNLAVSAGIILFEAKRQNSEMI